MDVSDPTALVRESYNRLGSRYAEARSRTTGLDFVERAVRGLAPGSQVLDVGCGPGVPITRFLADRGFQVTGVDVSDEQLGLAAQEVPQATLLAGDICDLDLAERRYDAVVAWDSVFHIPRAKHVALFDKLARCLRPGGRLLITGGGSAGEFTDVMLGERLFYSGYAPDLVAAQLAAAGLTIVEQVLDDRSSRGHAVFLGELGRAGG